MADPLRPVSVLLVEDEAGDILLMRQTLAGEPIPISIHVAMDGRKLSICSPLDILNRM